MTEPVAVDLTYVGIAKEVTKGTGVAPTFYIPVDKGQLAPKDKPKILKDQAARGSLVDVYDIVFGVLESEYQIGGPLFADAIGWPLGGLLGDVATTGAGAPYAHVMAIKNNGQPTAHSLTEPDGIQTRIFPGQQWNEVAVKFTADGMLEYTAKAMGWPSATASNPTASWTATQIVPAWRCAPTIAGSSTSIVETFDISFKRPGTVIHTAQNSQNPFSSFLGPLSVTGKMTLIMLDETEYTRFLNNTQSAVVLDFQQGSSGTLQQFKVQMTKCAYEAAERKRGKDYMQLDVAFEAKANTTDVGATGGYSPCKVTLQNQLASGIYV